MKKRIAIIILALTLINFTSILTINDSLNLITYAEDETPEARIAREAAAEEARRTAEAEETAAEEARQARAEALIETQRNIINKAEASRNTAYYNTLTDFQICFPTDLLSIDGDRCGTNQTITNTDNFYRLLKAMQNKEIITVLEEPLSAENIFQRARVCTTKFIKDEWGVLQPVDRRTMDLYQNTATPTTEELNDIEYIIGIDECREFFVKDCTPKNEKQTSVGENNALPIRIACDQVQIIFAESGSGIIKAYVGLIYRWAAGIVGVIAVIVIMINGISISMAGSDSGKLDTAKNKIVQSLVALAILFLAGLLLHSINPNYFTSKDMQVDPTTTSDQNK
jgi:hypothetical protein